MKIISWNVNGLQSVLKCDMTGVKQSRKPIKENILNKLIKDNDPDILCLQEIRCSDSFDYKQWINGDWYTYANYCTIKKGYSGTFICSKIKPLSVTMGFPDEKDEEGRLITAEYTDYYLINVYTPNTGASIARFEWRINVWEAKMRKYITMLQSKKPVILIGDLNVIPTDLDSYKPFLNLAGSTQEEKDAFVSLLKETGMIDTYRHLNPEGRKYSWHFSWSRKSGLGCRLDFCLISKTLINSLAKADIICHEGSDHMPILVELT